MIKFKKSMGPGQELAYKPWICRQTQYFEYNFGF